MDNVKETIEVRRVRLKHVQPPCPRGLTDFRCVRCQGNVLEDVPGIPSSDGEEEDLRTAPAHKAEELLAEAFH